MSNYRSTQYQRVIPLCILLLGILDCKGTPDRVNFNKSPQQSASNPESDNAAPEKLPELTGPSPLRRLTNNDYINSVTDMVGDISGLNIQLAEESSSLLYPFTNHASEQVVTSATANKFLVAAEAIAADTVKNQTKLAKLIPCVPNQGSEEICANQVLTTLINKAFRRPATPSQVNTLLAVWRSGFSAGGFNTGIEWALAALLQSPGFLYRIEMGSTRAEENIVKLDSWDMANRLSYFLWNSSPDEELITAAKANRLLSEADVAAQVERMLKAPRARTMMTHFHDQWLGLENIERLTKDKTSFPGYTSGVALAMREEVRNFVNDVVWKGDAKIESLFNSKFTYLNNTVGDFYGIKGLSEKFEKMDETKLGERPAAGLLTMGAILAHHSSTTETSPTHRGAFIRVAMFCQTLPNPPDNAIFVTPASKPNQTRRELIDEHSTNPTCAGCHKLMDPIGLVFENFDAAGRFRDKEGNKPIDVSSELFATDVNGAFNGPIELAAKLGTSKNVADCIATHWFQYAYGRDPESIDSTVLNELSSRLRAQGYFAAIRYLTQTPQFYFRTLSGEAMP